MSAPPPSAQELIRQVAQGDQPALGQLYDLYAPPLFSLARHFTGNSPDAEEVVQDVFAALWQGAADFDAGRSGPFTWMAGIARHKAIDRLRQNGRRLPLPPGLSPPDPDRVDPGEDPGFRLLATEKASAVRTGLAGLPAEQADALVLSYFEGMTHREIADRTGAPLGTVKSRIRLAMSSLRERLKERRTS